MDASRHEALLAVEMYNRPRAPRTFEAFAVHMHMAWLYLLHAEFTRDGVDFRYRQRGNPRRLERVDGEPKRWELAKCIKERWSDPLDPVRTNIDFFVKLRNKVEHRYARTQDALLVATSGHAHAHLVNYETELTARFGQERSLATHLHFPVFVGSFTEGGEDALRRLRDTLPAELRRFMASYHAALSETVAEDQRFQYRVKLVPALGGVEDGALAMEFLRADDLDEEERAVVEKLGRSGKVVVRNKSVPVANLDRMKPTAAARRIEAEIPYRFNVAHLVSVYTRSKIRPPRGDPNPERTRADFCVYDSVHGDYSYTEAFLKHVAKKCRTIDGFTEATGRVPRAKAPTT